MIEIIVNLALNVDTRQLYEAQQFTFSKEPTVDELIKALRKKNGGAIFSKRALKKKMIVILINGSAIDFKIIKKKTISADDAVTLLQPLAGG